MTYMIWICVVLGAGAFHLLADSIYELNELRPSP